MAEGTLTETVHVTGHIDSLNEALRNRLNEDALPDPTAWGVEDMTGQVGLLANCTAEVISF